MKSSALPTRGRRDKTHAISFSCWVLELMASSEAHGYKEPSRVGGMETARSCQYGLVPSFLVLNRRAPDPVLEKEKYETELISKMYKI